MGVDKEFCPECTQSGQQSPLYLCQINLKTAVYVCKVKGCCYPEGYAYKLVPRDILQIDSSDESDVETGTKAPKICDDDLRDLDLLLQSHLGKDEEADGIIEDLLKTSLLNTSDNDKLHMRESCAANTFPSDNTDFDLNAECNMALELLLGPVKDEKFPVENGRDGVNFDSKEVQSIKNEEEKKEVIPKADLKNNELNEEVGTMSATVDTGTSTNLVEQTDTVLSSLESNLKKQLGINVDIKVKDDEPFEIMNLPVVFDDGHTPTKLKKLDVSNKIEDAAPANVKLVRRKGFSPNIKILSHIIFNKTSVTPKKVERTQVGDKPPETAEEKPQVADTGTSTNLMEQTDTVLSSLESNLKKQLEINVDIKAKDDEPFEIMSLPVVFDDGYTQHIQLPEIAPEKPQVADRPPEAAPEKPQVADRPPETAPEKPQIADKPAEATIGTENVKTQKAVDLLTVKAPIRVQAIPVILKNSQATNLLKGQMQSNKQFFLLAQNGSLLKPLQFVTVKPVAKPVGKSVGKSVAKSVAVKKCRTMSDSRKERIEVLRPSIRKPIQKKMKELVNKMESSTIDMVANIRVPAQDVPVRMPRRRRKPRIADTANGSITLPKETTPSDTVVTYNYDNINLSSSDTSFDEEEMNEWIDSLQ